MNRWCRTYFASHSTDEDRYGINNARSLTCEVVAVECIGYLNEHDIVQYLTFEIPGRGQSGHESDRGPDVVDEASELLGNSVGNRSTTHASGSSTPGGGSGSGVEGDPAQAIASAYGGLNALEIAIVAEAKHFLSQKSVQRVVDGM